MRAPQREHNACDAADTATLTMIAEEPVSRCRKQTHIRPLYGGRKQDLAPIAEVHTKETNSVSQRLASSHT